uniref:DUF7378 domain-containing protein n=1 Tax=Leersia perrieri TaxID=77586 RepID=A0A0D9X3B6_9ORYZ
MAPRTVQRDLLIFGWVYSGPPIMVIAILVGPSCITWMVVTVGCLSVVLIYGDIAFWVHLVRTYKK